jgi:hypothetical protein
MPVRWSVRSLLFIFALTLVFMFFGVSAGTAEVLPVLSASDPGPEKIGLQVWSDLSSGEAPTEGDRLIITLQAADDGYLTIIGALSDGTTMVLFPNEKQPNNAIYANITYTFFGDDSPAHLRFGGSVAASRLLFFINSKQVALDWSKINNGKRLVRIPPTSVDEIKILTDAIAAISKDDKFNRIELPIGTDGKGRDFELIQPAEPSGKRPPKHVPGTLETKRPGTVTGTQGVTDKSKDTLKTE